MADEGSSGGGNKVVIELDLDAKSFNVAIGDITQKVQNLGHSGGGFFDELSIKALGLNAALELGGKALELWHEGLEKLSKAEGIKNQETALKNLTSSIGVDSNLLLEAIDKATKGTVTRGEAVQASYKLLSAGIKADAIPALAAWADKLEDSGTTTANFAEILGSVAKAVDVGTTRGLKDYGIKVEATGTRQQVLNSIMKQAEEQSLRLGDGYTEMAHKFENNSAKIGKAITTNIGDALMNVLVPIFGDSADKANLSIESIEKKLKLLEAQQKKGHETAVVYAQGMEKQLPIAEAIARVNEELANAHKKLGNAQKEENQELEEAKSKLTQTGDVVKSLTDFERQRAELKSRVISLESIGRQEEVESGAVSIKTQQDIFSARKALIEQDISNRRSEAATKARTEKELQIMLFDLEEERLNRIRALRVTDDQFNKARQDAELSSIEGNLIFMDQALERHRSINMERENQDYQKKLEALRQEGLDKEEFQKRMELEEEMHQKRLNDIRSRYETVNMRNFQLGLNQGLNQMRTQFGSFSNFVASASQKTHNIMVKGFVDMAKGHGDAMSKMLNQFLEMIGTQMIESGTYHLLKGAASMNPSEVGAGAALIAAGSALVGASSAGAGTGSEAGAGQTIAPGGSTSEPNPATGKERETKKATIIVNGFLGNREAANHLASIIRENSDITDYSIQAQGKQYA